MPTPLPCDVLPLPFPPGAPRVKRGRAGALLLFVRLCCLLALCALLAAARAGDCGPAPGGPPSSCAPSSPASLDTGGGADLAAGNPINVITGNKYQREEDLPALPGVLGLEIVRHYNSAYSGPGAPNGPLGREWKLSYETELFDKFGKIQILQADGARLIFDRDPASPNLCSTPLPANGRVTIARQADGARDYTWTWPNGRRLHFNRHGKLDRISAPTGESLTLQYDASDVLLTVTDPQGRSLQLGYPARAASGARFRGAQFIDSPVGRFIYEYGGAAPPGAIPFDTRILWANMARVRLPAGPAANAVSRVYHHEDSRLPWLLTGISIETAAKDGKPVASRFATFGYDANGLAILSTHAGNVDKVTLDRSKADTVVLTNSLGQRTVYRHAIIAGAHRLMEVRGAGCSTCGQANVRYGYDELGRLTDTTTLDVDGNAIASTRRTLDRLGRIIQVDTLSYHHGKAGPLTWRLRLQYDAEQSSPSVLARPSVVPGKERQTRISYNGTGQATTVTDAGWSPALDDLHAATPITRTTRYTYTVLDGHSLLKRIDGPLSQGKTGTPLDSDVTLFEYDHRADSRNEHSDLAATGTLTRFATQQRRAGLLTAVTLPGNFRTTLDYDAAGRIRTVTGTDGHATSFSYAPRGQIVSRTRDGITHATSLDDHDHPLEVSITDTAGRRPLAHFGHDAAGRPVWSASSLGILTTWRYDTEGHLLATAVRSNTMRMVRSIAYDQFGRPITGTDAAGSIRDISWNARDIPDTVTDALGRVTRLRYDAADQLIGVTPAANSPEARLDNTETRIERDVNGLPVAIIDPDGSSSRYLRDDFGRVVAAISSDSGKTVRRFDAADHLLSSMDAKGNRADYVYDAAGRILRQDVVDAAGRSSSTTWRYAGAHVVAIDHPEQSERYSYDALGRVSTKTVTIRLDGGKQASYGTRYRYDSAGQLAGVSLPDGSLLDYRRNGQNQVVALDRSRIGTSWLRWLLPRQPIVKDIERDVVGLKHLTFGNGIEAQYQRSKEGGLARIAYRNAHQPAQSGNAALISLPAVARVRVLQARQGPLPGALSLPADPAVLLDHRYLWDAQGNLLHLRDRDAASSYAYDSFDRLRASGSASLSNAGADFERYYFDVGGNRLLAQNGIASQSDTRSNTTKASYAKGSNRWLSSSSDGVLSTPVHDVTGQLEQVGVRNYQWDALGKLSSVREGREQLARYRYNHRGERIAKQAGGRHTYYLYDDERRLLAELDADGNVARQYIYLGDLPVAVIDTAAPGGVPGESAGPAARFLADVKTICKAWIGAGESTAYVLSNHLGAAEAVTDADGQAIWQVRYAPFGLVHAGRPSGKADPRTFDFNLRLPGQYADKETGLYYNDHRYYDPRQGRYLTPAPLDRRGGANAYAYVNGNPLKYSDPYGLILFAFDGTGNSETPPADSSISNVLKFALAYDQDANGPKYYITGIGTTNADMPYAGNKYTGDGFDQRVALAFSFLNKFIAADTGTGDVNVDVVGFSRGAAEARVWINQLVGALKDDVYTNNGKSRCINLRFEGLWDTVSHLGLLHGDDSRYDFSIPSVVKYAVQAVALNEYRGGPADFDTLSIQDSAAQSSSATRIEKGFIGAHSDIGGGFGTGDLSDVALMWMIAQAQGQGISILKKTVDDNGWGIVTDPIVHDKSTNRFRELDDPSENRDVVYGNGSSVPAKSATFDGLGTADARADIAYFSNPYHCGTDANPDVGLVDMVKYKQWLQNYGLSMATGPIDNHSCR